jgi:hypothetical protein
MPVRRRPAVARSGDADALIEYLLLHPDTRHLLLIGAYRDNEVDPAHPLMLKLEDLRRAGASVDQIVLGPLSVDDINQLLCDTLRRAPHEMRLFAELVHRRSGGGNPFFAGRFLASLAEERLIRFDPRSRSWTWDLDAIVDKRFSDNPVDLMIGRLRRLAPEAQEALKLLACLGSHADFATLAKLRTESDEATRSKNWRSMLKSTWFQPLIEPTAPLFELRGIRRRILNAGGKHREALTLIVDAIDVQQRGGKLLYMPALFRMKGLILASRSGEDHFEAEESLLLAIGWEKRQHASLFELKAATDLAGLLHTQGRVSEKPTNISARHLIEARPKLYPPTYKRALQILDDLQPGIRAVG